MSKNAGKSDTKQAIALQREAVEKLEALGVPTVEAQQIALQNPELVGQLTAQQLGSSSFEDLQVDPRLQNAQYNALQQLAGLSQQGLSPEDIAQYNQVGRQAAAQAQANRETTLQDAAQRGTLDSGSLLAAQLSGAQGAADRVSQQGMQVAANAGAARRQALSDYGNMASSLRGQDFNQQSSVAQAKDAIKNFNAQNRQSVDQYNLGNKQAIENQRAATANQQEQYNKGLIQQKFQNEYQKAGGTAAQLNNLSGTYAQAGQNAAASQAAQNNALIGVGTSLAGAALAGPVGAKVASAATPTPSPYDVWAKQYDASKK